MSRILTAFGVIACMATAPVIAQGTAPVRGLQGTTDAQPTPPTSQPPVSDPTTSDPPITQIPAAEPPTPAPVPVAAEPTKEQQVATIVEDEFPVYDGDKNGTLSKAEFTKWVSVLRQKSDPPQPTTGAVATKWFVQAFTVADVDKNKTVTKAEMMKFLSS